MVGPEDLDHREHLSWADLDAQDPTPRAQPVAATVVATPLDYVELAKRVGDTFRELKELVPVLVAARAGDKAQPTQTTQAAPTRDKPAATFGG